MYSYPVSLSIRRSSKVHGCDKREHCKLCAVFSVTALHAHVVSPLK